MRTLLATLAIAAGLSAPAMAAPPTKAELMQVANQAVTVCADKMPAIIETGDALKAAGFALKEADGDYKAYTAKGGRVVVVITRAVSQYDACSILVSRMEPTEAEQLIAPWLQQTRAMPLDDTQRGKRWLGIADGRPIVLGVIDHIDLNIVRGAAVLAGREKR